MTDVIAHPHRNHWQERVDLAAAFRWTARLNLHEAVANHFSLAINGTGTTFLINPNQMHFSRIKASDLLVVDANDPQSMARPEAPDPTAWGLHGGIHRHCPHARCAMHVHSPYATALACLADSSLPPVDQNSCMFFNRYVIDHDYGGLAFEEEGARCARLFSDPQKKVIIMGNHGLLVIGDNPQIKPIKITSDHRDCFEVVGKLLVAINIHQAKQLVNPMPEPAVYYI